MTSGLMRLLFAWTLLCCALLPPIASLAQFGVPAQLGISVVANQCTPTTFNPSDKGADIVLSGGNLSVTSGSGGAWESVRTVSSHASGKFYYEMQWLAGVSSILGAMDGSGNINSFISADAHSGGYLFSTNATVISGSSTATGFTVSLNDVFGFAIDVTNKLFWVQDWTSTSGWFGSAAGNPVTGTNGKSLAAASAPFFAAASAFDGASSLTFNFGATSFTGTVPTGFTGCF